MATSPAPAATAHRLAVWYGKGGVGKSTTTLLLSLLLASRGNRVLAVDLDPECGTSRDFLGPELSRLAQNLRTFLEAPLPMPLPIIASGIKNLDLVAGAPDRQRFFRLYPEQSTRLREGLALLPPAYQWIVMDVPNQFDNVAELGLIAADFLLLPVELTADCVERVPTALHIIEEARSANPTLHVIGALPLASMPRAGREKSLSAKELLMLNEYKEAFAAAGVPLFKTIMFRSSTTVEEARSNADLRFLHWTARRRFHRLLAEMLFRIRTAPPLSSHSSHGPDAKSQPRRTAAAAHA